MYQNQPIDSWPPFQVIWDERSSHVHHYGDGLSPQNIPNRHPNGVKIGDVDLSDLDTVTYYMNRQSVSEFWQIGLASKKSEAIEHWVNGGVMTPVMIIPHENGLQVCVAGGNHRLAVARAKSEVTIPVLFDADHESELLNILKINNIRFPK
ncbi:hypothetical protein QY211_09030 [Vibrio alginolyticus]|uniref:hypothetical protein n=1 Tax=Vibrio alginolyticus TaxID=663 RepID=UPI00264F1908|nr:hypothetical protein [Vibrio alginolyticus]MDN8584389.1 hypothetical protein [Vibrio alginolyticus]